MIARTSELTIILVPSYTPCFLFAFQLNISAKKCISTKRTKCETLPVHRRQQRHIATFPATALTYVVTPNNSSAASDFPHVVARFAGTRALYCTQRSRWLIAVIDAHHHHSRRVPGTENNLLFHKSSFASLPQLARHPIPLICSGEDMASQRWRAIVNDLFASSAAICARHQHHHHHRHQQQQQQPYPGWPNYGDG